MRLLIVALLLLCAAPLSAHAAPLKVVASFSILGDMVKEIARNHVEVSVLVGPNSDAHLFEPSPSDIRMVGDADLVIVNGLGFEAWLGRLIVASGYTGQIVRASNNVNTLTMANSRDQDPHAWQDLANGKIYVANIRDALIKADPDHADDYRQNAADYLRLIDQTDAWGRAEIAKVPVGKRRVIASHDAFQYFSKAYGIAFVAAQAGTQDSTPSATQIAQLVDLIRARNIKVVFMENIADPRLAMQLETDAGAHIGGTLFSDALSVPGGPADSYLALFRYNVETLVKGMAHN